MGFLQGAIPPKTYAILCVRPHARCTIKKSQRFSPPTGVGKEIAMDVNTITDNKQSRITEIQIGETLFTVVSIESDRAKEHLYDKVKRLILDGADRSQAA